MKWNDYSKVKPDKHGKYLVASDADDGELTLDVCEYWLEGETYFDEIRYREENPHPGNKKDGTTAKWFFDYITATDAPEWQAEIQKDGFYQPDTDWGTPRYVDTGSLFWAEYPEAPDGYKFV